MGQGADLCDGPIEAHAMRRHESDLEACCRRCERKEARQPNPTQADQQDPKSLPVCAITNPRCGVVQRRCAGRSAMPAEPSMGCMGAGRRRWCGGNVSRSRPRSIAVGSDGADGHCAGGVSTVRAEHGHGQCEARTVGHEPAGALIRHVHDSHGVLADLKCLLGREKAPWLVKTERADSTGGQRVTHGKWHPLTCAFLRARTHAHTRTRKHARTHAHRDARAHAGHAHDAHAHGHGNGNETVGTASTKLCMYSSSGTQRSLTVRSVYLLTPPSHHRSRRAVLSGETVALPIFTPPTHPRLAVAYSPRTLPFAIAIACPPSPLEPFRSSSLYGLSVQQMRHYRECSLGRTAGLAGPAAG